MTTSSDPIWGETLLEARGIRQVYGSTVVLQDLSVRIRDVVRPGHITGQVVAFLGPSGIGKTTLFNILAGLDTPTEGDVTAMQDGALKPVVPGSIGVVNQHYPLFHRRTVLGNMLVAARGNPDFYEGDSSARAFMMRAARTMAPQMMASPQMRDYAMELLNKFGLADHADKYPAFLSGGQRQRVAIAQQIITGSTIILKDEPFSGIDPLGKDAVCQIIRETAHLDEHTTMVIVSHDIPSALRIADTVWLMGRVGPDGEPIEGARIVEEIDLTGSIAWREDNHLMPEFHELVQSIEARYPMLKGQGF